MLYTGTVTSHSQWKVMVEAPARPEKGVDTGTYWPHAGGQGQAQTPDAYMALQVPACPALQAERFLSSRPYLHIELP